MPIRAYHTVRFGPINLTVSRSGWSWSFGGRRARVGRRTDGRARASVRLPGGWRARRG